jgi:hypothetical protein
MLTGTQTGHGTVLFTAKKTQPVEVSSVVAPPTFVPPTSLPPPPVEKFVIGAIPNDKSIPINSEQIPPPPIA